MNSAELIVQQQHVDIVYKKCPRVVIHLRFAPNQFVIVLIISIQDEEE